MIDRYSTEAARHPIIAGFMNLVEQTVGDEVLSFEALQQQPFMPFWRHLIIAELTEDASDFKIVFFGTGMLKGHARDWTGHLMADMQLDGSEQAVRQLHFDALHGRQRIFASGTFEWLNKKHSTWHQVKMPLKRGDAVRETLTCVVFEQD